MLLYYCWNGICIDKQRVQYVVSFAKHKKEHIVLELKCENIHHFVLLWGLKLVFLFLYFYIFGYFFEKCSMNPFFVCLFHTWHKKINHSRLLLNPFGILYRICTLSGMYCIIECSFCLVQPFFEFDEKWWKRLEIAFGKRN